jgi:hypothetical protein
VRAYPPGGPSPLLRFRSATNRSFLAASRCARRASESRAAEPLSPTATPRPAICENARVTCSPPHAGHGALQPAGTISSKRAPQTGQSNS